jgi:[protein-PII] uridylyltransferase
MLSRSEDAMASVRLEGGRGGADREPDTIIATLRATGDELRVAGPPPGRAWCEAWSDAVDNALRELAATSIRSHRLAVVAVGGYGRRELCPNSDIDLLLLHDRISDEDLEVLVRQIVYPLWDAGLKVGYAVRDRREALGAVDDLDSATATLDLRAIAGDVGLAQLVRTEVVRRLRRRPHRFLAALRIADQVRRAKAGDAAEVLEPDLKNGAGGLRDIQSLRWAAAALVGTAGLDPLVPAGYLGAPDRPRLSRAENELLAARVALHLVADRTETLRLDLQDPVADRLGIADVDDHQLAPHVLLNRLYLAARTVDHVHRRAWALIDADVSRGKRRRGRPTEELVDGFELVDGVLRIPQDQDIDAPDLHARLLAGLASSGAVLDRGSAARLRERAERGEVAWRWTDGARDRAVRVLWRGSVALPALAELDEVGVWVSVLPEWAPLRGRPQRNPYHLYALDRHAWHAAAQLGELVRRERWAAETLGDVDDREGLMIGTLLHDIGKAFGEPHAETGVPVAEALARRMGARPTTIDLVGRLVRLHLVLPDAARKRDVADPALAQEIAAQIGDRSTLACLHLLAVADGRATGPTAWTEWMASLVASLVTKVRAVLEQTHPDEVGDGAVVTAREAQELAPELGADPEAVREHLSMLPSRYAAAVSPRAVVRHTLMTASRPGPTEVRTRVTPGELDPDGLEGIDELDVVALDSHGWFAKVAGVVALHGGSVVAADAFSRQDGLAVDTFKIQPPEGAGGSWWARVEGDLSDAAAGRLAVRARVARKARTDDRRVAKLPPVPTSVTVETDPAGRSTVLEIRTLDRIGVLYAIAMALAELELEIVIARIQTLGHEVVDVFFVRDGNGDPLDDDHLAEVDLGVTAAIAELA